MRVYAVKDYEEMSKKAADILGAQILSKPDSVLGLATGSTPIGIYEELAEGYGRGELDFSRIRTVNLDEYKGLDPENEQSYRYFMNRHLFDRVNIPKEQTHLPDGTKTDGKEECKRYERLIDSLGGVDIQLLGMGHNGHIGFNEPSESFAKETHCEDLQESTIKANTRFFESEDEVPRQAYTMGIGTIFKAGKILVVVSGRDKADAVKKAFWGPITPKMPASILQLHPDVTLVADREALSLVTDKI